MKKCILFILAAMLFVGCNSPKTLADSVVSISPEIFETPQPQGKFVDQMKYMLLLNNKYALNKWYNQTTKFASQTDVYIDFGGIEEKNIRPTAHTIFSLATSLKFKIYDPTVTGVAQAQALEVLRRLISSSSYRHLANNADKQTAWGDQWQSALWASQIALGAWIVWDQLDASDREMVAKMVEHESNRFIDYEIPYYRDLEGNVIFKGDTKAEENSWNSNILTVAVAMMPSHPNRELWQKQNIMLQLSAYSSPEDTQSDQEVDGVVMREVLKGSNINSDGTVVNHKIIHPDYMCAIMHNVTNVALCRIAQIEPLESSLHNGEMVYRALAVNKYDGKSMYQPTAEGKASCEIYFPQGNDWGGERQANYWLMDIMADKYNWTADEPIKPLEWAQVRGDEMLRMMERDTTGQYYQSKKEDRFFSREQWIGFHLAWGYIEYLLR